jgi:serine/threonine-protein kinase
VSELLDRLQSALGPAYRLDRELGGGGMSRVFVAEETALGRQVVVKVLSSDLAKGLSAERFRREILVAAKLHHPHIVPLIAAGEADGLLYYTMPYIQGESLRARLDRDGTVGVAETLRLVREVADALAFAHRHGVVHRDIKPGNVLLADGHALVADFGVAKAVSQSGASDTGLTTFGMALGTPAYMAPEQAAADPHTDHRADLYSLGVVAYEMLTGRLPFRETTPQRLLAAHVTQAPDPISEVKPAVPAGVAALVMRSLEKHPPDRWRDADELIAAIDDLAMPAGKTVRVRGDAGPGRPPERRRRAVPLAAAALAVLVLGGFGALRTAGVFGRKSLVAEGMLAARERVLIADFDNRTADSSLGVTVTEAFRVDLTQSPIITAVSPEQVRETLARMRRDSVHTLTFPVAREVALREGIKAVVTGEISSLGGQFVVSTRLVSAESGDVLAAYRETASGPAAIIHAVDRASKELRERIGESVRSIRGTPPLEQATTASLDALRKYSQGLRAAREGNYDGSLPLFEEAVQLDTAFGSAYRALGITLSNRGEDPRRMIEAFTRAYQLRDRLTERERYLAEAAYFTYVDVQHDRIVSAYRSILDAAPDDRVALNNLGIEYQSAGDDAKARPLFERALRNDSSSSSFANLLLALWQLGDTSAAARTLEQWRRTLPDDPTTRAVDALLLGDRGRYDSAGTVADALAREYRDSPFIYRRATELLQSTQRVRGKVAEALRTSADAARILGAGAGASTRNAVAPELAAAATDIVLRRNPGAGVAQLDALMRSPRFDRVDLLQRPYGDIATLYAMAGRADRAREVRAAALRALEAAGDLGRRVLDQKTKDGTVAGIDGAIALAERRPAEALTLLRDRLRIHAEPDVLVDLAHAYDAAAQPDSAIALFERYLASRAFDRIGTDQWRLAPALRRLGELYEARNDRARAREYYARFVELWRDADADLQPQVSEAKRRLAELTAERPGA